MTLPIIYLDKDGERIVDMSPIYKYDSDSDEDFKTQIINNARKNAEHYREALRTVIEATPNDHSIIIQLRAIIKYYTAQIENAEERFT